MTMWCNAKSLLLKQPFNSGQFFFLFFFLKKKKSNQQNKMRLLTFRVMMKHIVVLATAKVNTTETVQVTILSLTRYKTDINNL